MGLALEPRRGPRKAPREPPLPCSTSPAPALPAPEIVAVSLEPIDAAVRRPFAPANGDKGGGGGGGGGGNGAMVDGKTAGAAARGRSAHAGCLQECHPPGRRQRRLELWPGVARLPRMLSSLDGEARSGAGTTSQ